MKKIIQITIAIISILGVSRAVLGTEEGGAGLSQKEQLREIRSQQAEMYQEESRQSKQQELEQLRLNPKFQAILNDIATKEQEISASNKLLEQFRKEQPRGARTRENIQLSYLLGLQKLVELKAALTDLKNTNQYKRYTELMESLSHPVARTEKGGSSPASTSRDVPVLGPKEQFPEAQPHWAERKKVPSKKEPVKLWTRPAIATVVGAAVIAGGVYKALTWYKRRRIVRTLARYDVKLTMLSSTQKDALAAAFKAGYHVPGSLRTLARLVQQPDFASSEIPAQTMWTLLADLYYHKAPTPEHIEALRAAVAQY